MRSLIAFFLLLLIYPFNSFCQESGNSDKIVQDKAAKYPFKNAQINYQVTGDATGSSTLLFDRNGWRSSFMEEIALEKYGLSSLKKSIQIIDGDHVFLLNLMDSTGSKSVDRNWSSLIAYKENDEIIKAIMEKDNGSLKGTEEFLGYSCRIWEFSSGTIQAIWEYNGIPLKIYKELPGYKYVIEATEVLEEDPSDEVFVIPAGITWN